MKSLLARSALALAILVSLPSWAEVSVAINIAPPPLPLYAQPQVPGEGYIWTPGYWSWRATDGDYYWVPGTWVLAPNPGELWTPGYWAFQGPGYFWHVGYWGRRVGFYGGLNYGHGYTGSGYQGGRWDRGVFRYNRAASNVNVRVVRNVYNTVVINKQVNHISFNGGEAGVNRRPTVSERRFQEAEHRAPTADQVQHERTAVSTPGQRATVSHGAPPVAATPKPSGFEAPGVEHAKPARAEPPAHRAQVPGTAQRPAPEQHAAPRAAPQQAPRTEQPKAERPERAEKPGRGEPNGRGGEQAPDAPRKER